MNRAAFTALEVKYLPGIEDNGFILPSFSPGVNLLYGPNGIGKSVTARALSTAIWPLLGKQPTSLIARFIIENGGDITNWRISIEGPRPECQCDGSAASPPFPPAEIATRYRLSLTDLIGSEDASFAQDVLREAVGGYDLPAAANTLGYIRTVSRPQNMVTEEQQAAAEVESVRQAQENLYREEAHLADLDRRCEEARAAEKRIALLKQACEMVEARAALAQAESDAAAFPAAMVHMTGQEGVELSQQEKRRQSEREETRRRRQARLTARCRKTNAGISVGTDTSVDILVLKRRVDALAARDRETAEAVRRHQEAQERVRVEQVALPAPLDSFPRLDGSALQELSGFARRLETARANAEAARAQRQTWNEPSEPPNVSALQDGIAALQEWLSASLPAAAPAADTRRPLALAAITLSALLTILLGYFAGPGWLVLLMAPVALWLMLRARPAAPAAADPRPPIAERFNRVGAPAQPTKWEPREVEIALRSLREMLVQAMRDQERFAAFQALLPAILAAEKELEDTKSEQVRIAEKLGISPEALGDGPAFWLLCVGSARLLKARVDAAAAKARADECRRERDAECETLNVTLAKFGYRTGDAIALPVFIEDLERRLDEYADANRTIAALRDNLRTVVLPARRDRREARRCLFERLDLPINSDAIVLGWLKRHPEYRMAVEKLQQCKGACQRAERQLDVDAVALAELSMAELQAERERLDETARSYADLHDLAGRIRGQIDQARTGNNLERANARLEMVHARLRERREEEYARRAGVLLTDFIKEQTRDTNLPPVFHRAREILMSITQGRWRLDLETGARPSFRATDTVAGIGRSIDELSSGTRIQLVLAVRIAFVELHEQGCQLPLLLDETLANSDNERMQTIIEALLTLAREGRQIFYFTARADEVHRWQKAALAQEIDCQIHDMSSIRGGSDTYLPPPVPTAPPVPAPDGCDAAEYAALLRTPPINPAQPATAQHLFYALRHDLPLLHRLLSAGITNLGQWKALREIGRDTVGVTAEEATLLDAWCDVACAFHQGWRQGRGRSVTREALVAAGVTATFIDRICDIARDQNGDAGRLLEIIRSRSDDRVAGFRQATFNQLRDHLLAEGFLTEETPLDVPGLVQWVVNHVQAPGIPPEAIARRVREYCACTGIEC